MAEAKTIELNIDQVKCEPDKYPRKKLNQISVAMLQATLSNGRIPPIEVNQNYHLIDGAHRLQAHKLEGLKTIKANITECPDDDVLWLATERNSTHGQQLSREEKKDLAKAFYKSNRGLSEIQTILAIGKSQLYEWLETEIKKQNDEQNAQILDLYLRCFTEEQIADKLDMPRETITKKIANLIVQNSETGKMNNRPDTIQDYNLWEFNVADDGAGEDGFPGRMPGQVIENLLWYYTNPFDLVLDPMSGGGTTLDVCLSMSRRCLCYDINPIRPHEIKKHDISTGLPDIPKLRKNGDVIKPKLIVLDPPYWKQKKGEYSSDKTNLANLTLDDFHSSMIKITNECHEIMDSTGFIAYIISPTRSDGVISDHMALFLNQLDLSKWQIKERIIVSYTTQQALAYHITQAREGKYMLRRYRDLLILQRKN